VLGIKRFETCLNRLIKIRPAIRPVIRPACASKVYALGLTVVSPVMLLVRFLLIVVASRGVLAWQFLSLLLDLSDPGVANLTYGLILSVCGQSIRV
jgi:hypothetical protein